MLRYCLLLAAVTAPWSNSFGADPPQSEALQTKIAERKKELAELERDLAALNTERPTEIGEWIWAGGLKVRVTGAELRDVKSRDFGGKEIKTGEVELVVKVEIATLSKARRVFYQRPVDKQAHELLDDRGTKYALSPYGSLVGDRELDPGAPTFRDEFHFKKPADKVREVRLTLKELLKGEEEEYRFRIPATAWVVDHASTVKRLEKVAGVAPGAGDEQKLRDAIAVLKRLEALPQLTEAQKERAKRSEDLAARIAVERDEITGWELTAGAFAGPNEWVQVGDVRVRFTKVWLQDKIVVDSPMVRYGPAAPWLMVRVEVENRSKTKAVTYTRWSSYPGTRYVDRVPPLARLTDRHGNRYPSRDYFAGVIAGMKDGVAKGRTEIGASGAVVDIVCFDEPMNLSGDLLLTLDPVQDGEKGSYRFRIPAAEWKPKK